MSSSTGENEQFPSVTEGESEELPIRYTAAIAFGGTALVTTIIVSLIVSRMYDGDEIKLHILDALVKIFQTIARITGSWAIECENAYNEYVNILH